MALFGEHSSVAPDDERKSSHAGGWLIVVPLLLVAASAGAYLLFSSSEKATPIVVERVVPAPTPRPEPEPEPVRPAPAPPEPEPDPTPPPAEPTNVLRVTSDVDGAHVFLDRRFLGNTPFDMADLEPGMHRLNVAAQGHEGVVKTIDISDEPVELNIEFRIVRLDEMIDVIHKHRFGSCQGRLVANLQGFHYQTAHDDAFAVPLNQVESFEIDYLDHTLYLKVRGDRDYTFTDEQKTADPLFVFHRDVEKARTRLAQGDRPAGDSQ